MPLPWNEAYDEKSQTFHSLPENSLDVIAYGSSHAFKGINTARLNEVYGISCYNYDWNWQKLNTIKTFIYDSLLSQKPKIALIEAYTAGIVIEDMDLLPEVYYCRYLENGEYKDRYMKQCLGSHPTPERVLSYICPLAMFHDNWNSLTEQSFRELKQGADEELLNNRGYSPSDSVIPIDICGYDKDAQKPLPEESLAELDEIVDLCRKNDIIPVFYIVPWNEPYEYNDAMASYAAANDCVFLDLSKDYEAVGLDGQSDYSDLDHLNTSGSDKVADYIGKYLTEDPRTASLLR
ncbi:MAG: SGNH/GDSL hydrolase family protein [Lachnospiraceae bacterium]|nr:SGNH/GDSL hydrolase family protein [Lachnospiraceae bacterium]